MSTAMMNITYGGTLAAPAQAAKRTLPWLPLLPLLAIPALGTDGEGLSRTVIAIEFVFLAMAVRNPIWLLGAVLLSELSIRNYFLTVGPGQISMRLFITLASMLILLPHVVRGADLGRRSRPLLTASLAFLAIILLASVILSQTAYVIEFARYLTTGLLVLVLVPLVVRTREDVVQIGTVGLIIATVSAVVAILQHYSPHGAPLIQLVPNSSTPQGFADWGGRAAGLAENPIYITSDLLLLIMPVIGLLLVRAVNVKLGWHLALIVFAMAAALLFSETRSWVVGVAAGLAVMAFVMKGRVGRELLVLLLIAGLGFAYWADASGSRYGQGPAEDSSAATRPVLWSAALHIAVDHPLLGIGHDDKFQELSPEYATRLDPDLLAQQRAGEALGIYGPHNDFLNVWVSFGTLALFAYVLVFWLMGVNFIRAWHKLHDPLLRGLALGGLGALVAYIGNSSFHNLFDSTLAMWLIGGFSLALLAIADRQPPEEEQAA